MNKCYLFRVMKLLILFLLVGFMHVTAASNAQTVTLDANNLSFEKVLKAIKQQSGYAISGSSDVIASGKPITIKAHQMPLLAFMAKILADQPISFEMDDKTIVLLRKNDTDWSNQIRSNQLNEVAGQILDQNDIPVAGATVTVVGMPNKQTIADNNGFFKLTGIPDPSSIKVTAIGFSPLLLLVNKDVITIQRLESGEESGTQLIGKPSRFSVRMRQEQKKLAEVIVNGIFTREKESFTGSAAVYSQNELKQVGGTNIIQSLKTLDPAFAVLDNKQFGSDPNRLANIEIRGKSSMLGLRDELDADPNQPLFILDGFESTLAAINDLDINRIESITILKDAASTAIYGSKAANGVIVVETIKPKAGKLQVNYSGNTNISAPDLTSYNLMNAREKLEFEYLSELYESGHVVTPYVTAIDLKLTQRYHSRLKSIAEGVDTYWLAEPLRVGNNQKHSLYVMGGEGNFMFGLGGGYNGVAGVMKDSKRDVINGNVDLIYRTSKFQFSNKFSATTTQIGNPVVPFQEYARANPYYKKVNSEGMVDEWLEYNDDIRIPNPIYNASLNSRDIGKNLGLSNFFVAEWTPSAAWKLRSRFGLTYTNNDTERFISSEDTRQIRDKATTRRGEFVTNNTRGNQYEGEVTLNYAKVFGQHRLNLVGGGNMSSAMSLLQGYSVEGFPSGQFSFPTFANGYPEGGRPTYRESISRSLNSYFNTGYSFDDRYLMDLSLRSSGSSIFGSTRRFNTTWSVGLGWNIHREHFIRENLAWINFFKIRGSIGNPGNQSFDSGKTLITYRFPQGIDSYFGLGALPDQIGNPDLKWQITQDKNIGLDLTVLNRRVSVNLDYYHKVTNPLLIALNVPFSSGTQRYFTNAGEQISKGFIFSTVFHILRNTDRRLMWSVRANGRTQTARIGGIGNRLDKFNLSGRGTNTTRYYDGADPDDIWVVRSVGIDPSNGKELFLTKNGDFTYDFTYEDEVIGGNARPALEGVIGSSVTWKNFTLNLNFRYQMGADVFNSAVRDKVENVDMRTNLDRRALYERWNTPGDIRYFKNIRDVNSTPLSSRFVQRDNVFALESVYMEYQFRGGWIRHLGLGNMKVFASMRDVFRLSTIYAERGIDYPFARVIDTGLSFNF